MWNGLQEKGIRKNYRDACNLTALNKNLEKEDRFFIVFQSERMQLSDIYQER